MGMLDINLPDDFLKELFEMDTDEMCKEALDAAAPIIVAEMQDSINRNLKNIQDSTGELMNSIKAYKANKTKNGAWVMTVGPTGYSSQYYLAGRKKTRKYKLSNAGKLIMSEYGTSTQAARPILAKVVSQCEVGVMHKLQEIYNKKVGD